ncbi:leucyl aminopeptidase [Herbiconiux daphne]|uniref:Probable cytosol aminopeptidase n=1 Tax=Herbiconiux daphne TaxID=2970914 RepID=A0ABT2GZ06_9MICO|nr:leucyl aminopeptidase [Herbiconiux daphne]MCS5733191.1 leucyl aminopeptidase [Herbiconiux daphne]
MTTAPITLRSPETAFTGDEILVLAGVKSGDEISVRNAHGTLGALGEAIAAGLAAIGFSGKKDELVRLPAPGGLTVKSVAVVGLGTTEPGADDLRYAAGVAARRVPGRDRLVIDLDADDVAEVEAIVEGAGLGSYDFSDYRGTGSPRDDESGPREIEIVAAAVPAGSEAATRVLARARASVDAVALVRDLVNIPALDLYPEVFAERVGALAADRPLEVTEWDFDALVAGGFGGIAGVGQGSTRLPRLVRVDYSPAGATKHIALVGKGITFDTGGLSLKPPISMIGMKDDMAGAATVLAAVLAAADLGLAVRLTAWLCLAENMPSGDAIRPGDVLTIHGGRTVEVLNTDAEGRLVMADGLVAASEENPDAIIDVATLTGAAIVALGNRYVGAMGDEELTASVVAAAREVGEPMWPMPLPAELRPLLASDIADIANVKPGNTAGGMLVAGVFLEEFVGTDAAGDKIPWVHLDIAGPALNKDSGYGFTPKGPTGVAVRTLVRFAERYSRA